MKNIKRIIITSLQGIGIACTIYMLVGMVFDYLGGGSFALENWMFTKQAIATILIGIAFSAPSEIYRSEKLPFAFKFLFHMGIGCCVYLTAAFYIGWIPVSFGIGKCILIALLQILTALIIWLCFSIHYRKLAKSMNEKIKKNAENDNNGD